MGICKTDYCDFSNCNLTVFPGKLTTNKHVDRNALKIDDL